MQATAIVKDQETKIEILTDDLGWCKYLLGQKDTAVKNVEKAIELADEYLETLSLNERVSLAKAKALRHLAIIRAEDDIEYSSSKLDEALMVLSRLDDSSHQVKTDIAQIYHAKATIVSINLDIRDNKKVECGYWICWTATYL